MHFDYEPRLFPFTRLPNRTFHFDHAVYTRFLTRYKLSCIDYLISRHDTIFIKEIFFFSLKFIHFPFSFLIYILFNLTRSISYYMYMYDIIYCIHYEDFYTDITVTVYVKAM